VAQLRRLHEMFPEELAIIDVHSAKFPSEQLTENIRQAVMRHDIQHPVVNDAGFKIWNAYAVRAWPTLVLIDPNGRIAGETSGEILAEEFAENIREVIRDNAEQIDRTSLDLTPETQHEPLAVLRYPSRLLVQDDLLFIADTGHNRIVEVRLDPDGLGGEVLRIFGRGHAALADGPASEAAFHGPHGLGLKGGPADGTLFVADTENHAVRAIDLASGAVTTVAGTGQKGHGRTAPGLPTKMPLRSPWAVLPLAEYLFIAMAGSHQVWVLLDNGRLGPFAGNGVEDLVDGPVAESSFNQPSDLVYGFGYLLVADPEASAVRAISLKATPQTMTLVGQGLFDFGDQDGPTSTALLQHCVGLCAGEREIYVVDTYNHKIKLLDPSAGEVSTLIGTGKPGRRDGSFGEAQLFEPEGAQYAAGRLWIADTNNHRIRVANLTERTVRTFQLRGIARLPVPGTAAGREIAQVLPAQQAAAGRVRLVLDVRLPEGYKRNLDAPSIVVSGDGERFERFTIPPNQPLAWDIDLQYDTQLLISLTLYYCQEQDAGLCLIHDRQMIVPLTVVPSGSREIHVPVVVQAIQG